MSQDSTHGQANPHAEPEHVSVHTVHIEASSYVPQQPQPQPEPQPVLEQFAGQNPNLAIPMFQPQMVANMFQFFQQMARAHVPPPPPPSAPIVSIEKLKRNGAQEFCGDQIADPQIAKRCQERTVRVLENLKVPVEDWGQHAISLLQDAAYDWWKRVGANIPVPVSWTTFEPLFKAEYVPDHYVEAKYEEFSNFTQGKLTLPEYRQQFDGLAEFGKDLVNTMEKRCKKFIKGMRPDPSSTLIIAPRADINDVYKKALELNEELIRKAAYEQALLEESRTVQSGPKMGHGRKRTFSAPSNSRHDKRAKSTPSASVAVTSKNGKEKVAYRRPGCPHCGRRHAGECWLTQGLCLGCGQSVVVSNPLGHSLRYQHGYNQCPLMAQGKIFLANLIELPHKEFDVILGMDWLTKHQAIVECQERVVKLRTDDGNEVIIWGELLPKAPEFISYMQAKRLIRRKYEAFLCTVKDIRKETLNHKDIYVVCDFPDVFSKELPGLPPSRDVEFSIDLVPANVVADALSRKTLAELLIRPTLDQDIISAQHQDTFCLETRELVSKGEKQDFSVRDNGTL
ncbi:unnamed protein product [Cuscuta campestris]|uniref:Retrotransposon gag domain-containing protein n=1 Tax=Cuscuta campestris TaxID=132261 RepID=A0A484LT16_9ASTE|nr:unnamed protein product [Cuscuta campestris]